MQPLQMNLRVGLACCASTRHFESCTLSVGSGKAEMVHQYFSNPYPPIAVLVEVNGILGDQYAAIRNWHVKKLCNTVMQLHKGSSPQLHKARLSDWLLTMDGDLSFRPWDDSSRLLDESWGNPNTW